MQIEQDVRDSALMKAHNFMELYVKEKGDAHILPFCKTAYSSRALKNLGDGGFFYFRGLMKHFREKEGEDDVFTYESEEINNADNDAKILSRDQAIEVVAFEYAQFLQSRKSQGRE